MRGEHVVVITEKKANMSDNEVLEELEGQDTEANVEEEVGEESFEAGPLPSERTFSQEEVDRIVAKVNARKNRQIEEAREGSKGQRELSREQQLVRESVSDQFQTLQEELAKTREEMRMQQAEAAYNKRLDSWYRQYSGKLAPEVMESVLEKVNLVRSQGAFVDPEQLTAFEIGQRQLNGTLTQVSKAKKVAADVQAANLDALSSGGSDFTVDPTVALEKPDSELTAEEYFEKYKNVPIS